MVRRQKSKDKKRRKSYQRKSEDKKFQKGLKIFKNIDPVEEVDYTEAKPIPLKRSGHMDKGDAL